MLKIEYATQFTKYGDTTYGYRIFMITIVTLDFDNGAPVLLFLLREMVAKVVRIKFDPTACRYELCWLLLSGSSVAGGFSSACMFLLELVHLVYHTNRNLG